MQMMASSNDGRRHFFPGPPKLVAPVKEDESTLERVPTYAGPGAVSR